MHIFITGTSKGLGEALAITYLELGHTVYGCSRGEQNNIQHPNYKHFIVDLEDLNLKDTEQIVQQIPSLDIVILNAALLGEINLLQNTTIQQLQQIQQVNVWANKILIDCFIQKYSLQKVIGISTGASKNANKGWGAYGISKAAFNFLIQMYAAENSNIHFLLIAPGLIDTDMQKYLCSDVNENDFPSIQRLKEAKNNQNMFSASDCAKGITEMIEISAQKNSGDYWDIREYLKGK